MTTEQRNESSAATESRPSWHERITLALGAYRDWMHVTPAEYWMDKAMKAAGFREVIAENLDLRRENERLRTLIEQAAAEANHGELTDGTLASMTEVSEDG